MLLISFWPTLARSEEQPCRYEGERVSCTKDGFKGLTDLVIQHRARADKCELRLNDANKSAEENLAALHACQAIVDSIKPCPAKPSPAWALSGIGAAVLGTVLLSAGLVADIPSSMRLALAGVGAAAVAGGVVLAWP